MDGSASRHAPRTAQSQGAKVNSRIVIVSCLRTVCRYTVLADSIAYFSIFVIFPQNELSGHIHNSGSIKFASYVKFLRGEGVFTEGLIE